MTRLAVSIFGGFRCGRGATRFRGMNTKLIYCALMSLVFPPDILLAEIKTQTLEYRDGDTVLEGMALV